jgi:hypothetical protein
MSAKEASGKLEHLGFSVKQSKVFSKEKPGRFLSIDNAQPGEWASRSTPLQVSISAGPGVPKNTVGMSVAKAAKTLVPMGVPVYAKQVVVDDNSQIGSVVLTSPAQGHAADGAIYLGIGVDGKGVPWGITGMAKDKAKQQLEKAGYTVDLKPNFSSKKLLGKVTGSNPKPGSAITGTSRNVTLYYGVDAGSTMDVMTADNSGERTALYNSNGLSKLAGTFCQSDGDCIDLESHQYSNSGNTYENIGLRLGGRDSSPANQLTMCISGHGDIGQCMTQTRDGSDFSNYPMSNTLLTKKWGMFELFAGSDLGDCEGSTYLPMFESCQSGYVSDKSSSSDEGTYPMRDLVVYFPVGSDIKALEDSGYFDADSLKAARKDADIDATRPFILLRDSSKYDTTSVPAYQDGEENVDPFIPTTENHVKMKPAPSNSTAYYLVEDADDLPADYVTESSTPAVGIYWLEFGDYTEGDCGFTARQSSGTDNDTDNDTDADDDSSDSNDDADSDRANKKIHIDEDELSSIVDAYSTTDTATSIMPLGSGDDADDDSYGTQQSTATFVASGLYLPVYLMAKQTGNSDALAKAESMMRTMSNDDANAAIFLLGGRDALNSWLHSNGYTGSTYNRAFGDVAASDTGAENTTTPRDAARMMAAIRRENADTMMNVDLVGEGIRVPDGMTVHAHRGQGIGNAYNVFAVATVNNRTVGVSIMTRTLSNDVAKEIVSSVLADIDQQLR